MDISIRALTDAQRNLKMLNDAYSLGNTQLANGDFVCINGKPWDPHNNLQQAETAALAADVAISLYAHSTDSYKPVVLLRNADNNADGRGVIACWDKFNPISAVLVTKWTDHGCNVAKSPLIVRNKGTACPEQIMAQIIMRSLEEIAKALCAA